MAKQKKTGTLESAQARALTAYMEGNPNDKTSQLYPVEIGGDVEFLEVWKIPTALLTFNIRNGRFAAEMRALESQKKRRIDARDPSDARVIEDLLLSLNPIESKALRDNIFQHGQLEPGIITHDGEVINANRRMATLRSLARETGNARFEKLAVVRLRPNVSHKDLWRIEAGLQFAKDFRVDYGPVNELLKLREGIEAHLTPAQVSNALLGRYTEKQIDSKLKTLALIETYLERIGKPEQYQIVQEEANVEKFNSLQNNVIAPLARDGTPAHEIAKITNIAFALIEHGKHEKITHWDIRDLKAIAQEDSAKRDLLQGLSTSAAKKASSKKVIENFRTAQERMEAMKDEGKPERLLKRALSAVESIPTNSARLHHPDTQALVRKIQVAVEGLVRKPKK